MTQQVSHRSIKCQSRLWSQRGTKINGSHAAGELGRNPVSKHQIQPEYGDEQADAGRNCRTRLARPNSQARTETGEISIFPVQLTTSRTGNLTRLIHTLAICVTIHHSDNPLLRPTGIKIATKSYATLQAMAPTNIKTVPETPLLHIESSLDRLGLLSPTHDQRSQQQSGQITFCNQFLSTSPCFSRPHIVQKQRKLNYRGPWWWRP